MARRLPPLTALRAFEAVARHLSMARAAEELHVTPAAISQQIRQLEDLIEQPLFKRGGILRLSNTAEAVLPLLTDAFDRLERAAEQLRPNRHDGPLVVSAPPAFAARWLVPRLEDFETQHPDIELRLLASRRLVDFSLEDVDCAIRFGDGLYPGLAVERLWPETIVPVATPDIAADIASVTDIARKPLLEHRANRLFPDWETWFTAQGVVLKHPLKIRYFSETYLTLQAALTGFGVALAWSKLVADDIQSGRLIWLLNQTVDIDVAYHLVALPSRLATRKVVAFRSWMIQHADNMARFSRPDRQL